MRAVHCVSYGDPKNLIVVDLPEPKPGLGEVLVAVEAAGLGYADALNVKGAYQVKRPLPFVPGGELAGHIVALGSGVGVTWMGSPVFGMAPKGSLAERIVMPVASCVPRPAVLSAEAAAGMIVNYGTALHGFDYRGHVQPGETVLILGASGGVGLSGIDMAKALGATVIAAASSPEKLAVCAAHGADHTVDYSQPNWRKAVESVLAGRPLNVVYDAVGGAFSEIAFRCLAPGGRHLVIGFAAGEIPRIALNLPLLKRASIVGVAWGEHHRANPGELPGELLRLVDLVVSGRLHPEATSTYPLEKAGEVLQALLDRKSIGKSVIRVSRG